MLQITKTCHLLFTDIKDERKISVTYKSRRCGDSKQATAVSKIATGVTILANQKMNLECTTLAF
jgi:hypothetical protein